MKLFYYFIGVILISTSRCSNPSQNSNQKSKTNISIQPEKNIFDLVKEHQILLMNSAEFKQHPDLLLGASSFLIDYNNKVYAITAKHLIGKDGGIEPEIDVRDLNKYFISWTMFPRVPITPKEDTVKIQKPKLNYNLLDRDILLLEVENDNFSILSLKTKFSLPNEGDTVYIIGCPYSEENCKQNIYPVKFVSYNEDYSLIICSTLKKFEIRGFSGAPLVDIKGSVMGTITAGWNENNIQYVGATFIKEIQKIK